MNRELRSVASTIQKDPQDIVECPECRCTWFETVEVKRFAGDQPVVLGQMPPAADGGHGFYLLKCMKCGNLCQPELAFSGTNFITRLYDDLLRELNTE